MKKRKIAMLVMTGVLLTGCMGTNYLEEGVSQLEEKQYEEASKSFQKEIDEEKNLDEAYHTAEWELHILRWKNSKKQLMRSGRHWTMGQKKRQRYIILSVSVI